ncbi:unnamed protein product, partial [Adineta ricciae]
MTQKGFHIVFLVVFFLNPTTSDIRASSISIRIGWQLLSQNTTRLPYTTLSAFNFRICQMKCLLQSSCQVAVFHQSTLSCDLFTNISTPIDNLLVPADPRTITIIIYNQILPQHPPPRQALPQQHPLPPQAPAHQHPLRRQALPQRHHPLQQR